MKTVITYGTFDLFHIGHYNILKRAKALGDYLIVAVTGEQYDMERGKLSVQDSLAKRIENVRQTGFADLIIVEEYMGQKVSDIQKYNVDILVVGSDWRGKFDHLNKYCQVVYLERTKDISSTQKREDQGLLRLGIVTDTTYDNQATYEPKKVSGIHVESVFSEDPSIADAFRDAYELDSSFGEYGAFLEKTDIVYIKSDRDKRYGYAKAAIEAGKHVICDPPCSLDPEREKELAELAAAKDVVWANNMTTLFLRAYNQLIWNARGNMIGDLVSIRCGLPKNLFDRRSEQDFIDLAFYPVCTIFKILGTKYNDCFIKTITDEKGDIRYGMFNFAYENSLATAEVSIDLDTSGSLTLIGTEGEIVVPDEWWRVGYFEMKRAEDDHYQRYSFNFEGNGFRYLIQSVLQMIRRDQSDVVQVQVAEAEEVIKVLAKI